MRRLMLEWYLYFTGRLQARCRRVVSELAVPGCSSLELATLSLCRYEAAGDSKLPLRLLTKGTDTRTSGPAGGALAAG